MKALIDGDPILHAVANAVENKTWTYLGREFENKKTAVMHLKAEGKDPSHLVQIANPEPWSKVETTLSSYLEERLDNVNPFDFRIYIGGDGNSNFRYNVATILPYKGNRTSVRPSWFNTIREFMVAEYGAELVYDIEADDALGINWTPDTILCHVDKDIDMIPGWHYNFNKEECYEVTKVEGLRYFYKQMLTGDKSSDNILGLHGIGAKSKYCKTIDELEDEEDMFQIVSGLYFSYFGNYAPKFFEENARLLWILRNQEYYGRPYWEQRLSER